MNRRIVLAVVLVGCIVGLGAVAVVTREEFDALEKRVRRCEAEIVVLKSALTQKKKASKAAKKKAETEAVKKARAPEKKAHAAAAKRLTGEAFNAWKLARDAVQRMQQDIMKEALHIGSRRNKWGEITSRLVRPLGSIAPQHRPPQLIIGEPTEGIMQRTPAGDYVFSFARVRIVGDRKVKVLASFLDVYVTKYETELRVEKILVRR